MPICSNCLRGSLQHDKESDCADPDYVSHISNAMVLRELRNFGRNIENMIMRLMPQRNSSGVRINTAEAMGLKPPAEVPCATCGGKIQSNYKQCPWCGIEV